MATLYVQNQAFHPQPVCSGTGVLWNNFIKMCINISNTSDTESAPDNRLFVNMSHIECHWWTFATSQWMAYNWVWICSEHYTSFTFGTNHRCGTHPQWLHIACNFLQEVIFIDSSRCHMCHHVHSSHGDELDMTPNMADQLSIRICRWTNFIANPLLEINLQCTFCFLNYFSQVINHCIFS